MWGYYGQAGDGEKKMRFEEDLFEETYFIWGIKKNES